jgi:hypothetical protein
VSGSDCGSDSWSTLIFQGSWMRQGKGGLAYFQLELENQGVGYSFMLEPKN